MPFVPAFPPDISASPEDAFEVNVLRKEVLALNSVALCLVQSDVGVWGCRRWAPKWALITSIVGNRLGGQRPGHTMEK